MLMVEDAGKDASKRCTNKVLPRVVRQDVLWVAWVPDDLHDNLSGSQSWVQTGASECIDLAEHPEDEADGGDAVDAEVRALSVLAGHVKDEQDEDESHDNLHVAGRPILL